MKLKKCIPFLSTISLIMLMALLLSCTDGESRLSAAPNTDLSVMGETARFLAGEPISETSTLAKHAQTATYKKYAADFSTGWNRFQKPNLQKMENWWKEHAVKNPENNVLYPFSGPDIMNVLAFFPNANSYTMFGLEAVGEIPAPQKMSAQQIDAGLSAIRHSINSITNTNFFHTNNMAKDLKNTSLNGITGLLMVFLTKTGYTVIDARKVTINAEALLVPSEKSDEKIDWMKPPKSRVPGVEISFKKDNGKIQIVRYFMLNVIDQALTTSSPNFIPYITKNGPYSTFLKSASYLMHNDKIKFTQIRAAVLASSTSIVQDDSGVPLRYFSADKWNVTVHGVYDKPIPLFSNRAQADLKKLTAEKTTGVLPFSYGYDHHKDQSNLLIAEKKKQ